MPIVIGKIVFVYYPKLTRRTGARGKHIYIGLIFWASSLCAFIWNTAYIYTTVRHYVKGPPEIIKCIIPQRDPCTIPANSALYKDTTMVFIVKAVIVPPLLIIEFLIAVFVPKNVEFPKPPCLVKGLLFCCHNSCKNVLIKVFQTLAFYQIILFIQILTIAAIPACVLLFVSPPHTILLISFVTIFVIAFTVLVLLFLFACENLVTNFSSWSIRFRSCRNTCLCLVIFIAGSSIVLAAVYFYGIMLYSGIDITGIQGVGLSLLPSILLSVAGWIVKKRLCSARRHITRGVHKERPRRTSRSDGETEDELIMQSLLQEQDESEAA